MKRLLYSLHTSGLAEEFLLHMYVCSNVGVSLHDDLW